MPNCIRTEEKRNLLNRNVKKAENQKNKKDKLKQPKQKHEEN
jgi:hypothetical protein